jgi:hypothetical protein
MAIDVGELRAVLTLQDAFTKPLKDSEGSIQSFSGAVKGAGAIAASFAGVVAGATAAVVALGQRGAAVADVQGQFTALAGGAESAQGVLEGLRTGVVGTMSDFDLMANANKALGSGLIKTASDAETLSAGARLLAKRTGGDTAEAFDKLTGAMASGRTASLKQLGLFVDSSAAAESFAKSIGVSVKDLSEQQRAQALSTATLAALNTELKKTPADAADFGELIEQGMVHVRNFTDSLGVAISSSPAVLAAMRTMGEAFSGAFGGDKSQLVQQLTGYVNQFAIGMVQGFGYAVEAARFLTNMWLGLDVAFNTVMGAITGGLGTFLTGLGEVITTASVIPGVGEHFKGVGGDVRTLGQDLTHLATGFSAQAEETLKFAGTTNAAFDTVAKGTERLVTEMGRVSTSNTAIAATAPPMIANLTAAGEASRRLAEDQKKVADEAKRLAEQQATAAQEVARITQQLQGELLIANAQGIEKRILEIEAGYAREVESLTGHLKLTGEQYADVEALVGMKYGQMAVKAVTAHLEAARAALAAGTMTKDAYDQAAIAAENSFKRMLASGLATYGQIGAARAALGLQEKQTDEEGTKFALSSKEALKTGALQVYGVLAAKYKEFAIAGAVVDTYKGISKALSSAPWPASLALAAGAAAVGWANVDRIRNSQAGFRFGTPAMSFEDFGTGTATVLHGREAVVNETQAQSLTAMVESAIRSGSGGDSDLRREFAELKAELRAQREDLRLYIPLAMRDAMLQARGLA